MSADAAVQLQRLLEIIPKLSDGKSHSLASVAALTRTNPATVLNDLLALSSRCGEPGGFVPGLEVYLESDGDVSLHAAHFKRPMGLTAAELCALELGLAMVRTDRPSEEHHAIDATRERLRKAVAKLPRDAVPDRHRYADLAAAGDTRHLAMLRQGIQDRRKVRLTYRASTGRESTTRTVCPYGLVAARGAWFVVAYCEDRDAIRIFRLDRIEEAKGLNTTYPAPPSFSVDAYVREGRVLHAEDAQLVRIRYSPKIARWIAEREHVAIAADGGVTVDYPLADEQWAVRHVLQYGPDAEVLAPDAVRQAVVSRLESILGDAGKGGRD